MKTIYLVLFEISTPDGSYTEAEEYENEAAAQARAVEIATPPAKKPSYAGIYKAKTIVYRAERLNERGYRMRGG